MRNPVEAPLIERLRQEGKRLRSAEGADACAAFEEQLAEEFAHQVREALAQEDSQQALTLLIAASPLLRASRQLPQGLAWFKQALALPSTSALPKPLLLRANLALGQCLIASGDSEGALRPLRTALASSDTLQDRRASLVISNALATACDQLGRIVEAQVLYQNAIEIAEQLSSEDDQCMLYVSLSASYLMSGRFPQAATAARQALSFRGSTPDNLALGALNFATASLALGEPEAAEAVQEALAATEATGNPVLILGAKLHQHLLEPDPLVARREAAATLAALEARGGVVPPVVTQLLRSRELLF